MFCDRFVEVEAMQFCNAASECSYSGDDEPIRIFCFARVVDDLDVGATNL
jgi:hypothetical protein